MKNDKFSKIVTCCLAAFLLLVSANAQILESTHLPIVVIETGGQNIPDEPKITADMGIIYNGPGQLNHVDDPFNEYDGKIGIELRGATSQFLYPKKQYAVETRNAEGENNNVSLLGMPAENDWVLYAPYGDKTLIRNVLAYKLAAKIMDYAPRTCFCEVLIDGEYMGLYVLTEKIKRDKNRVNIARLEPEDTEGDDLTGGYILKLDKYAGEENDGFFSAYPPVPGAAAETFFQYHYPKPADITNTQEAYIQDFIGDFDDLMNRSDYADSLSGYENYIDPATFVDYLLINEMSKNVDAYRLSAFLYKDKNSVDGRLKAGPVWDFNLAFGNVDFCMGPSPQDWVLDYYNFCPNDAWLIHFWWQKLRSDLRFRKRVKLRWESLRRNDFSNEKIWNCIDSLVDEIGAAKERNFQRWPIQNEYVWPNAYVGGNYENDLNYLKDWLALRLDWLDGEIAKLDEKPYDPNEYFAPKAFPNPFQEEVTFSYYIHDYDQITILIYNTQGQLVAELQDFVNKNGENRVQWINNAPPGFYFYSIFTFDELIQNGKLIKQ